MPSTLPGCLVAFVFFVVITSFYWSKEGDSFKNRSISFLQVKESCSKENISGGSILPLNKHSLSIPLPSNRGKDRLIFSRFRCFGDENNVAAFYGRACLWTNVCYNRNSTQVEYYQRSPEKKRPVFFDARRGHITDFGKKFVVLTQFAPFPGFSPVMKYEPISSDAHWVPNLHVYWRPWSTVDANLGHLLWEEIGSIFYGMRRFNIYTPSAVVMDITIDPPSYYLFDKILDAFVPAITSKPVVPFRAYMESFNKSLVCFESLMAGGVESAFLPGSSNFGRESLFYEYRNQILRHYGMDPYQVPNSHRILVVKKEWSFGAVAHRTIKNHDEVVQFLRSEYPWIEVVVPDLVSLPFHEQIREYMNTTIILTPCGGISQLLPFLPEGAHAVITDFYSSEAKYGFDKGISASMEAPFWNHWPHFKKNYYQVREPDDYVMDFDGATDTRDYASVVIKMDRLRDLIDGALEDMDSFR